MKYGVLVLPVLSAATVDLFQTYNASVTAEDLATVTVSFDEQIPINETTTFTQTYTFTIDKSRWLLTELEMSGYTSYNATYLYDEREGLPVLRKVAVWGDTTMTSGGLVFEEAVINAPLSVRKNGNVRWQRIGESGNRAWLTVGKRTVGSSSIGGTSRLFGLNGRSVHGNARRRSLGGQLLIESAINKNRP